MPDLPPTHQIGFVLLPDFSNMGLAAAVEPLFIANWLTGQTLFAWTILSLDGLSVRASNGMYVPVQAPLGDPLQFNTILLAASFNARAHAQDDRLLNWVRRAARFGVTLGGIETASEVLAAAGLLDGHAAAVHWYNLDGFAEQYPKVAAGPQSFSAGRARMTCGCGTSSLEMMLNFVATHATPLLADEVAQHLMAQSADTQGDRKDRQTLPSATKAEASVAAALLIMQQTLESPLSCGELAARLNLSERQLQRHFKARLGVSVGQQNMSIRLERAHKYIQQTDLSITEVALACGFGAPEHFSRIYRRAFGAAPSTDRLQVKTASVFRKGRLAATAPSARAP